MDRKNVSKLGAVVLAATAIFIGAIAPAAQADDTNVTITGGNLTLGTISTADFPGVTLDGSAKSSNTTMSPFSVTDARGTGAGWNVTIEASEFAEFSEGDYVNDGRQLGTSRLSLATATVDKIDSSSSATPSMTAGTYTLDAGSAIKVASAATDGTGMGSYTITPGGTNGLSLSVPASAFAATYRSDVTVTLSTGP